MSIFTGHKKASDATAAEVPPPPHDEAELKSNRALEDRSRGLIPPLTELKYVSVGGSHTNTLPMRDPASPAVVMTFYLLSLHAAQHMREVCGNEHDHTAGAVVTISYMEALRWGSLSLFRVWTAD